MLSLRNFYVNIITFWSSQGDLSSKKTKEKRQDTKRGTFGQKGWKSLVVLCDWKIIDLMLYFIHNPKRF